MCPRATAQRGGGGGAMAAAAGVVWFGEEEYIDLDLSSCGEFEFRVRRSSAADELPRRGRYKVAPRPGAKQPQQETAATSAAAAGGGGGRRSAATVAPLQHSQSAGPAARPRADQGSRRRKAASAWTVRAKLQASRAFFRSLFARSSCSHEQCRRAGVRAATAPLGAAKNSSVSKAAFGETQNARHSVTATSRRSSTTAPATTLRSSIEREKLMDEAELAAAVRQRKSFSGVIRWRHAATATAPARPPPSCSSSSSGRRRSCSGGSGGPALKRCSSARSESERLIQGAIAYCKRSQQQLGLARKSVSDAALCSFLPALPPQLDSSSAVAYHLY
ncbi:hypothetical protein ACP4OV_002503 [Aristida adscensionis]